MSIFEYLDKRNKRNHLRRLLNEAIVLLKAKESIAPLIDKNNERLVCSWVDSKEKLSADVQSIKTELIKLCSA